MDATKLTARKHLLTDHPTAIDLMDEIGKMAKTDFTSGIVDVMEEYHLAKSKEEAEERYDKAIDESYAYLIEKDLMPKKAKFQIAIQDALRLSARIASGKEEGEVLQYGKGLDPDKWMKHRDR